MPGRAVASVVGFGGMLMATCAGQVLQNTGSYQGIFALIGFSYLFALLVIDLLASRLGEPSGGGK